MKVNINEKRTLKKAMEQVELFWRCDECGDYQSLEDEIYECDGCNKILCADCIHEESVCEECREELEAED